MTGMDVFKGDGFSAMSMTAAINKQEYLPSMLGDMGLFTPKPIKTTTFAIESVAGVLALIPSSDRGAPIGEKKREVRELRDFRTRRIARKDTIMADEIQGIRAFGSETELMQVQTEVAKRQMSLLKDVQLTWEHMRLGAIQGIVLDADGSTEIYNFFTEFGVSQAAEIDFDLDNATPASGAVRKNCTKVVRQMQKAAEGAWIAGRTRVIALCGDNFWDDLTAHAEVRETYLNQQEASELRGGLAYETVNYGGITFINYRGTDDGSKISIGTDKCRFFPADADGVFEVAFSPAEKMQFVNTPGLPVYSWQVPDRDDDMYVDVKIASYPSFYCTRPKMLQRAKRT